MSGAKPGPNGQSPNESIDDQRLGAVENRIEVAIVKADAGRSAPEDCDSCFEALTAYLTGYPGQSVTRQDTLWHKRVRSLRT